MYHKIWSPKVGEELSATIEKDNPYDECAIALKHQSLTRDQPVVGYLPREISNDTSILITNGGQVSCRVTDTRSRRAYISGKGLEIPIEVTVTMDQSEQNELIIEEYKRLVNEHYREPIGM